MTITSKKNGTALEIALEGRLDTMTAPELEAELGKSLEGADSLAASKKAVEAVLELMKDYDEPLEKKIAVAMLTFYRDNARPETWLEGLGGDFVNYEKLKAYYDFGGIRIEDDVLVTPDGARRLGKRRLPVTPDEVEAAMSK